METRLRRSFGYAQDPGNLGYGTPVQVVVDEDVALSDLEPIEGRHHVAGGGLQRLSSVREVEVIQRNDRRSAPQPQDIAASVQEDLVQPRIEARPVSEARKVLPCRYAGVLGRVAGVRFVTQDGAGMPQEPIQSRLDEVGEGTRLTFRRTRDQGVLAR